MWISTADWMRKTNANNVKLTLLQEEYYKDTFKKNIQANAEMARMLQKFIGELKNAIMEDDDKVQGKKDNN